MVPIYQFLLWSMNKVPSDNFFRMILKKESFLLMLHLAVSLNLSFYESLHSTPIPELEQAQFSTEIHVVEKLTQIK